MSNELDLSVLKSIISNNKIAVDFVSENDAKLFGSDLWNFANVVVGYVKTYKTLPTCKILVEKSVKNPKLAESIAKTWELVSNHTANELEFKHDLEKLKKRFADKQILSFKESVSKLDDGNIDIEKFLADINKTKKNIEGITNSKAYDSRDIKEFLPEFVDKFNRRKNNPEEDIGLLTHYSGIDFSTNGFNEQDMVVISGESGYGKSVFLKNFCIQVWLQRNKVQDKSDFSFGKNVIFFSLEMPYDECFGRLISRLSGVPSRKIEKANLSKDEMAKVKSSLDFIKNYPYQFRIVDLTEACSNDIEKIMLDSDVKYDAIFVDYLGIMKPNELSVSQQDWQSQSQVAYELRQISRKNKITMFSAVQLNRKTASKDAKPGDNIGLNRLSRSSGISTHCTHVLQIENRPNEEQYPDFIYHIIKNRKGPKGKFSLMKNLSCITLLDKPVEEDDNGDFIDQDDISKAMEDLEI